jgi:hypothetical protein
MIKIVKLENTYTDEVNTILDVFYVEYSDSKLISSGDFILDSITKEMTTKYLEYYFEKEIYVMYNGYEEHHIIQHVNKLIYRMSNYNSFYRNEDGATQRYLTELSRDIKLNKLFI